MVKGQKPALKQLQPSRREMEMETEVDELSDFRGWLGNLW